MLKISRMLLLFFLSLLIVSCSDTGSNPQEDNDYKYDIEFTQMSIVDSVVSFIKADTFALGNTVIPFIVFNGEKPQANTTIELRIFGRNDSAYYFKYEVPENLNDEKLRCGAYRIRIQGKYDGVAEFVRDGEVYATVRKSFYVAAPYTR